MQWAVGCQLSTKRGWGHGLVMRRKLGFRRCGAVLWRSIAFRRYLAFEFNPSSLKRLNRFVNVCVDELHIVILPRRAVSHQQIHRIRLVVRFGVLAAKPNHCVSLHLMLPEQQAQGRPALQGLQALCANMGRAACPQSGSALRLLLLIAPAPGTRPHRNSPRNREARAQAANMITAVHLWSPPGASARAAIAAA
jgi:hypothetical protein